MDISVLLDLLKRGSAFDKPIPRPPPLSPRQRHELAVKLQQAREYRRTHEVPRPFFSRWQIRKMQEYAEFCRKNDAALAALGESTHE